MRPNKINSMHVSIIKINLPTMPSPHSEAAEIARQQDNTVNTTTFGTILNFTSQGIDLQTVLKPKELCVLYIIS